MVPAAVKSAALARALTVIQPPSFKEAGEVAKLAGLRPDTIVVAAYGQLLPQSVLDIPRFGCVNIHPSLLPRHRGPSPVAAAILAGDELTGVSIMLMDKGMDTGPVLAQSRWAVSGSDTTGTLTDKLAEAGADLLMETLPLWLAGRITPRVQDNAKATYSRVITKDQGWIDWHCPAPDLWRRVRAFQPWPGCHTTWEGKLFKIIEAVPLPGNGEAGRVVGPGGDWNVPVGVQTGSGTLGLLKVQLEGKRVVSAEEFIRGHRGFAGSLLPG